MLHFLTDPQQRITKGYKLNHFAQFLMASKDCPNPGGNLSFVLHKNNLVMQIKNPQGGFSFLHGLYEQKREAMREKARRS